MQSTLSVEEQREKFTALEKFVDVISKQEMSGEQKENLLEYVKFATLDILAPRDVVKFTADDFRQANIDLEISKIKMGMYAHIKDCWYQECVPQKFADKICEILKGEGFEVVRDDTVPVRGKKCVKISW